MNKMCIRNLCIRLARRLELVVLITMVVMSFPAEAKAYTDPGTGAFLLQALLAGITGSLFFVKVIRTKISSFFRREKSSDDLVTEDTGEKTGE